MRTNLEIKVGDFSGVEVVHPLQDLLDELRGLLFAQRLLLCEEVKQLTSRDPTTPAGGCQVNKCAVTIREWDRQSLTAPG